MYNEGLIGDVKFEGSLDCSDYEMVEFRTLRGGRKTRSQPWTSREQALASSKISLEKSSGIKPWREKGPKKAG